MPEETIKPNISNQQKYLNYKEQCERLTKALTQGFYLEAMFIEYALMEDRTESVLRHAILWDAYMKSRKGREANIDSKIKYIQKQAENKKSLWNKYFADNMLENILVWKNDRNRLIHALLKQKLEADEIQKLVEQGKILSDDLKSRSGRFNRAVDKVNREENAKKTIEFYNEHANQYVQDTLRADMSQAMERFCSYLPDTAAIVDLGAGSGRDTKTFLERGYAVDAIDASEELCTLASEYTGIPVQCVKIQNWKPEKKYDGLWANASLLHLDMSEITTFIGRLKKILNVGGYAYVSMKSGIITGLDEKKRYFTDFTKEDMEIILAKCPELELTEYFETSDSLNREEFVWGNFILKRIG